MSANSLQKQLQAQLIDNLYVVNDDTPRFGPLEIHGMFLEAFPELQSIPYFHNAKRADRPDILKLLFKAGEFEQAKSFLRQCIEAHAPSKDTTWVAGSMNYLATEAVSFLKTDVKGWKHSAFRQTYSQMIDIAEDFWYYKDGVEPNILKQKSIQEHLFYHDIDLYKKCIDHDSEKGHQFHLHHWKSLLAPVVQGDIVFQNYLFDQLVLRSKEIAKSDLALGSDFFWRDAHQVFSSLGEDRFKILPGYLSVALEVFTPSNMPGLKKKISEKGFRDMILGAPSLLLEAKIAGVPMSDKLYKAALKPLEAIAKDAGRDWKGILAKDDWALLQGALESLMEGVDVEKLYNRKMSDKVVSVFAEIMPEQGWMEKASEGGIADMLMEDLGL